MSLLMKGWARALGRSRPSQAKPQPPSPPPPDVVAWPCQAEGRGHQEPEPQYPRCQKTALMRE